MSILFPTSLDNLTNPVASDQIKQGDDHLQRDAAEDEPEVDPGAVVGEQDGDAEDEGDTKQAL